MDRATALLEQLLDPRPCTDDLVRFLEPLANRCVELISTTREHDLLQEREVFEVLTDARKEYAAGRVLDGHMDPSTDCYSQKKSTFSCKDIPLCCNLARRITCAYDDSMLWLATHMPPNEAHCNAMEHGTEQTSITSTARVRQVAAGRAPAQPNKR